MQKHKFLPAMDDRHSVVLFRDFGVHHMISPALLTTAQHYYNGE